MASSLHDIKNAQAKELYEAANNAKISVEKRMQKLNNALSLVRETENHYLEAKILHRLGDTTLVHWKRIKYYKDSLLLSQRIDDIHLQAEFLYNMGNNTNFPIPKRLKSYKKAATLAERANDPDLQAHIYYHLGFIETTIPLRLRRYNQAIERARFVSNKHLEALILLAYGKIDKEHKFQWCQQAYEAATQSEDEPLIARINQLLLSLAENS